MSKVTDISQIRKYLNGELDARAMHELERRAQDDPFLADAIEGFEQAKGNQQANLNGLTNRLRQRIAKKERRIIPWGSLSIAASILIVLGAGIWFFSGKQQSGKTVRLAQDVQVEKKEQPTISAPSPLATTTTKSDSSPVKQKQQPQPKAYTDKRTRQVAIAEANNVATPSEPAPNAEVQAEAFYKPKKDSVAASELIVKDMNQKQQAADIKTKDVPGKTKAPASAETLVQSRVEGVSVTSDNGRTVTGVVMGNDGQPITGATVKVVGRPFGVVTDVNGKFALSDVAANQTLAVNYIGYNPKKIKVDNGNSLNITLLPASNSLSEVAVVKKDNNNEVTAEDVRPKDGWQSYNEYLKKNAQSPDGKTGKVKISFIVAADGSLSQFKVTKSLSETADKKAIDLISNGPAWIGGTNGKPKEVKVSVSFK